MDEEGAAQWLAEKQLQANLYLLGVLERLQKRKCLRSYGV